MSMPWRYLTASPSIARSVADLFPALSRERQASQVWAVAAGVVSVLVAIGAAVLAIGGVL